MLVLIKTDVTKSSCLSSISYCLTCWQLEEVKKVMLFCRIKDDFLKMCGQQNPCLSNWKNKRNLKMISNLFIHVQTGKLLLTVWTGQHSKVFSS